MGVFSRLGLRRNSSFSKEGSSRRGRRVGGEGSFRSGEDDPSVGKDSSTSSALFDLELSRGKGGDLLARLNPSVHAIDSGSSHAGGDLSVRLPTGLLQRIIYLSRPVMEFELDLLQDMRALRSTAQRQPDGQLDLSSLVTQLQDLGYACYLKRNNPADPGHRHNMQAGCLEKLRHEFIMCAGRADGSLAHWCLVDPRFRDQFGIGQPTAVYDRCLKAAPLEFVGTPLRLHALVETLCSEMAEAFASSQRTLPPWRKLNSMLSKWFDPEDMPGGGQQQQQQLVQQQAPGAGLPAQVQLQAAAGPPLSPFEQVLPQTGGFCGLSGGSSATNASKQSVLQLQAAAALAERQSSGGGSQSFYEALAMHQESMRLQQQQAAAHTAVQPSRRTSPPPQSPAAAQQQPVSREVQRHQATAAAAFMPAAAGRDAAYLDAAWQAASVPDSHPPDGGPCTAERSNKPRRRAAHVQQQQQQQQELQQQGRAPATLWRTNSPAAAAAAAGGAASTISTPGSGGTRLPAYNELQGSGSWSDLSTILETRTNSNGSSPSAAAQQLLAAHLGTSHGSRLSHAGVAGGHSLTLAHLGTAHLRSRQASATGSLEGLAQSLCPSPTDSSDSGPAAAAQQAEGASKGGSPGSTGIGGASQAAGGSPSVAGLQQGGTKQKAVSLLAKSLRGASQKQTWQNLLPTISTVRRMGPAGTVTTQRSWSWRSAATEEQRV
ncbi:hypothetical protein D9Q98_008283 [Chlorella vulgaris]|uniref:Uncharacterized protein n=1 Tax=Chlorella vulgaris TaxID=3077 RepID=A0A9D4YT94_CHLVU|nr:hypothetical protein D9Q98_008283 [Chlorella vulgaris]